MESYRRRVRYIIAMSALALLLNAVAVIVIDDGNRLPKLRNVDGVQSPCDLAGKILPGWLRDRELMKCLPR